MPFKWRRKKARKYDISTKNLFIVGVYLLDNVYLECTLNAESTGLECLSSIAQRIQLSESHFFGLRYVTKKLHFHWVDLEKPLKKQLDKYAQQSSPSHCLYFGVMFYVTGAHKIPDEVARYHYYLQLKNDIIDGRLPCSAEQAIRLAAYSLQAEFGDYEQDKYAAEDYLLFPKSMMKDETIANQLLSEAIAGHASLQGMPQAKAELHYVKEVQMMDGYGAEYYSAKDESRKDLYLGTSYAGIFARYVDGQSTVYYRWAEIAKVTQSKKFLEIDTPKSSVQFQMDDADTAKYVARLALLQRQFYKSSKANLSNSLADLSLSEESEGQTHIDVQQVYFPPESAQLPQELGHSQTSLSHLQEQKYSHDILQSSQQSLESSTSSQQQAHQFQLQLQPQQQQQQANVSTPESDTMYQQQIMQRHESVTPTPESDPVYVNRAALLPAYRPSPDYESVMQQRMLHQQQQQQQHHHHHFDNITPHLGAAQVYVHPDGMAYSQPEISQNIAAYRDEHGNYANVEALRNYGHSIYANIFQDDHNFYPMRGGDRSTHLAVHPTYSSPELNTEIHQQEAFAVGEPSAQESVSYHYKPPPPYPRTSSSTPDLAAQAQISVNAIQGEPLQDPNIPNLAIQQENVGMHNLIIQSHLDKSVEDLSGLLNVAFATPPYGQQVTHANINPAMDNMASSTGFLVSVEGVVGDPPHDDTDAQKTLTRDTAVPQEFIESTEGQKVLSDDQEDTSSEHSYSTFHAKESEESSDDEAVKSKELSEKEDSKIHIRMFTPQEAPPPSKIKEEAMLRESFRRLKIARTGSMNTNGAGKIRSSLRNVKETHEPDTDPNPSSALNAVNEQTQSNTSYMASLSVATSSSQQFAPQATSVSENSEASAMKEILERLGAPPPYPGVPPAAGAEASAFSQENVNYEKNVVVKNQSTLQSPGQKTASTPRIINSNTKHSSPIADAKLSQITVKRSSSVGTAPQSAPLLPPRKENSGKPRAATFSLDTVVPLSKPGIVLYNKDVENGTSVLKSEAKPSSFSDSDSMKCLSEKDNARVSDKPQGDNATESLTSLHDYCVGSDSDSDTDRASDGYHHMGPLRMASMNGLTLSRSVILSLMNDESRAPTDDRRSMLESKISEGQVYAEFEQIPKKSTTQECSIAKATHNSARNRFKDVLPYDVSRVKLTSRKHNPDGYINASHIKLTANDNKWAFIATQAPLANTTADFWQMIWENQTDVIAMLTPFEEMGKPKCFVYWPQETGPENKQVYGDFEVELQLTDDSVCYVTSRIILRNTSSSQEHMVWHLQYTDWPDHGCPEDTYGFLGFVDEIESMSRLAETESGRGQKSPVVVHCSAGVGRTGVVILTMVMKWCLEHNHNVDLPKALAGIRNQRMHMVQTMGQYRFIHDTLIQYLKNTRLI